VLPTWTDAKVEEVLESTLVARDHEPNVVNNDVVTTFKCCVTRKHVAHCIHDFFGKQFIHYATFTLVQKGFPSRKNFLERDIRLVTKDIF